MKTRAYRSDPVNVHELRPPTPGSISSWDDVAGLQAKMIEAVEAMQQLADDVGMAKTVLEFSSDRRKRALARACAAALAGGESVAKAESEARSSEGYGKELTQLQKEHQAAEQTLTKWETLKLTWSSSQSLLAMQRESVKRL